MVSWLSLFISRRANSYTEMKTTYHWLNTAVGREILSYVPRSIYT